MNPQLEEAMPEAADEAMPEAADEAMPEAADAAMPEAADAAMPEAADAAMPEAADAGLPYAGRSLCSARRGSLSRWLTGSLRCRYNFESTSIHSPIYPESASLARDT